jgi:hypothetical protein
MTNNNNTTDKGNTMKTSDITLGNSDILIENTDDSHSRWPLKAKDGQLYHRNRWIKENGDVTVVWDEKFKVYRVPAFKTQRDSYSNAKAKDIARWGSE